MKVIVKTPAQKLSNKDLARVFECSTRTIIRNLAGIRVKLGKREGHKWNVDQVKMIFEHLGKQYEMFQIEIPPTTFKRELMMIKFDPQNIEHDYKKAC